MQKQQKQRKPTSINWTNLFLWSLLIVSFILAIVAISKSGKQGPSGKDGTPGTCPDCSDKNYVSYNDNFTIRSNKDGSLYDTSDGNAQFEKDEDAPENDKGHNILHMEKAN